MTTQLTIFSDTFYKVTIGQLQAELERVKKESEDKILRLEEEVKKQHRIIGALTKKKR